MDINTLRGLATVFAAIAFLAICFWAYGSRRKADFEEAANLPFADEIPTEPQKKGQQNNSHSNNKGAETP